MLLVYSEGLLAFALLPFRGFGGMSHQGRPGFGILRLSAGFDHGSPGWQKAAFRRYPCVTPEQSHPKVACKRLNLVGDTGIEPVTPAV